MGVVTPQRDNQRQASSSLQGLSGPTAARVRERVGRRPRSTRLRLPPPSQTRCRRRPPWSFRRERRGPHPDRRHAVPPCLSSHGPPPSPTRLNDAQKIG